MTKHGREIVLHHITKQKLWNKKQVYAKSNVQRIKPMSGVRT